MKRWLSSLAAALVIAAPVAVQAEQLPFILQSEMGKKSSPQAFQSLHEFDCVVKHGNSEVAIFLAADFPPKHMDSGAIFLAEKSDFCLRRTLMLRLTPPYIRGALIETKYHMLAKGDSPIRLGKFGAADASSVVAKCLVAAKPESAKNLLATPIASDEQTAAYAAMAADISACTQVAKVAQVSPQMLRYEIAEALYRRQTEQQSAPASQVSQ